MELKRIGVFCGSSVGAAPVYADAARSVGRLLAERGQTLIYGGGGTGLMGAVADAVLESGGRVVGVIPHALRTKELAHAGLTEMHVVDTMHQRKALMADLADAFVALPGGLGTLEEICEISTWLQLGIHQKPCAFLNVEGYYDHLIAFLNHAVKQGFLREEFARPLIVERDIAALFERMRAWAPPKSPRWATRGER
ncbi:MAG: TIGR00730 family Rossman fold protein [Planctomycetes bacterium]|nr:TIGR00730 family Rossman fold protein [Planctomycetota bacterium]